MLINGEKATRVLIFLGSLLLYACPDCPPVRCNPNCADDERCEEYGFNESPFECSDYHCVPIDDTPPPDQGMDVGRDSAVSGPCVCERELVCNAALNCIQDEPCERDLQCYEGRICREGGCVLGCQSHEECVETDPQSPFCINGRCRECVTDEGCFGAATCDETTLTCIAPERCTDSRECTDGEVCGPENRCVAPPECPDGGVCSDAAVPRDVGVDAMVDGAPADAHVSDVMVADGASAADDAGLLVDGGTMDGAPSPAGFDEAVADLLAARGVPRMTANFDEAEVLSQEAMYGGQVSFLEALDGALGSYLEDGRDQESPLALLEFAAGPPCGEGTPQERTRCFLDDPSTTIGLIGVEGFPPENGESVMENWVISLDVSRLSDHLHWAIVDRSGESAPYNYGFN